MCISSIQEFYKNSKIFITGGTGFLGKILIEKLLRDTEVDTIYLLVREKKGRDIQYRVSELFQNVVFSRIKPEIKSKIKPIAGDIGLPNLGLSLIDRNILIQNVDIIFHVAATVNFNEPIKQAFKINVKATDEVLRIAKKVKYLKVFMHVSTMYSNCTVQVIEEKIYSNPYEIENIEKYLDSLTEEEANTLTKELLGEWPNTYTFTKALAEKCLCNSGSGLPLGIFRPSIVISTYKEPFPGWIDNIYGPTGVSLGILSGVIRVIRGKKRNLSDIIPVDMCVAGLLAATWDVAERCKQKSEIEMKKLELPVYNYVSSPENPIRWEEFASIGLAYSLQHPCSHTLWFPFLIWVETTFQRDILRLLLHYLPAFVFDLISFVTGEKLKSFRTYKKVHALLDALEYFVTTEWKFDNKNVRNLWKKMSQFDKELFPFSMREFSWFLMFDPFIKGIKKNVLKEDDSKLEFAKSRQLKLRILNNVFCVLLICTGGFLVYWILSKLFLALFYIFI